MIGVPPEFADALLAALRAHPLGREAAIVGTCIAERPGSIILDTGFGRGCWPSPKASPCRAYADERNRDASDAAVP